jgi:hypothetical protein
MKPRDWLRLLVPGICVGMLSACSNSSKNTQQSPPGFSQLPNFGYGSSQQQAYFPQSAAPSRSLASTPASKYPASFPTPSFEPKTAATPYGLIAYGPFNPSAVTRIDAIKRTPLPTRPQNLPETDAEEFVRMPNDVVEMAASKPQSGSVTIVEPLTLPQTLTTEEPSTQKPAAAGPEEPPLLHALRCFLEKRPDDFRETLKTLDASQRDVLQTLIPLMVNVGDGQFAKSDPRELAAAVDQLQALLWVLRPRAALVMDKFCFCREVKKFGQFEALGSKQSFRPGDMVEVYAEIRNVSSVPRRSEHGEYRTHLRSRLEIRAPSGEMVKFFDCGKPDETLTPQHDYYQAYRFSIPEAPAGAYTLNLEVRDVPTGRKVKQKLEFQIGQ